MTGRRAVTATQAAAAKAAEAADTVMAWLRGQPGGDRQVVPAATLVAGPDTEAVRAAAEPLCAWQANPGGPAGAAGPASPTDHQRAGAPPGPPPRASALAHPDWLYHRLQIIGSAADLSAFRASAAGAGTVPWQLDLDRVEEDLFHLLITPQARSLSLSGARILASQLRAAVARRHALALAQVGQSRACPFDLHMLVPVPDAILRRGPDDQEALSWLWAHWGTMQTLRHVTEDAAAGAALIRRAPSGETVWVVTFWSADWTPWRALAQIAAGWPTLRFDPRPIYDVG